MNELKPKSFFLYSLLLFLPFIYISSAYGHFSPYSLKGPEFLLFFAILSGIVILLQILVKARYSASDLRGVWTALLMVIGGARVLQGMSHQKPVGYLLAMILVDIVILAIAAQTTPKEQAAED